MSVQSSNTHVCLEPKAFSPFGQKQETKQKQKPAGGWFSFSALFGERVDPLSGQLKDPHVQKSGKTFKSSKGLDDVQHDEQKGEGVLPQDRRVSHLGHIVLDVSSLSAQEKYEAARKQLADLNFKAGRYTYRPDDAELKAAAMSQLREAAREGCIPAMHTLAQTLQEEKNGLAESVEWYERICEKSPEARVYLELGQIYDKGGEGVEPNPAKAISYYRMTIAKGYKTHANYYLALLLEKIGGQANKEEAFSLLKEVEDFGEAKIALARFYEEGIGVEKDMRAAVRLYKMLGTSFTSCSYKLAGFYMSGVEENGKVILPQDLEKAIKYYTIARDYDYPGAADALAEAHALKRSMNG